MEKRAKRRRGRRRRKRTQLRRAALAEERFAQVFIGGDHLAVSGARMTARSRMKPSIRGTSCSVAGRMVMASARRCGVSNACGWAWGAHRCHLRRRARMHSRSASALQALRDTRDALPAALRTGRGRGGHWSASVATGRPHEIHRVDIGIAELDRALQRRVFIEQVAAVLDSEDMPPAASPPRGCSAEVGGAAAWRQGLVLLGDVEIRRASIVSTSSSRLR